MAPAPPPNTKTARAEVPTARVRKLLVQGEADCAQGRTIAQEDLFGDLRRELTGPRADDAV